MSQVEVSGIFPSPDDGTRLLSDIRRATKSILPFPLREITIVDAAASIMGYILLLEFDDNSLALALRGSEQSTSPSLTPPAEAVAIRAAGYATEINLDHPGLLLPDESLLAVATTASKWARLLCAEEYVPLVLIRTASDLSARAAKSELFSPHAALAATLHLIASDLH